MRARLRLLVLACLSALVLIIPPAAQADTDFECTFILPAGTYDGNIVVPPGRDCFLTGVTVHGNIKALADAQLNVNQSTVFGNIEGDKADAVNVNLSTVHGNISATEGGPALRPTLLNCDLTGAPFDNPCEFQVVATTVVKGNIQAEKMTGSVAAQSNFIEKGNVQFVDNIISAAPTSQDQEIIFIWSNWRIAGDLQVFKNTGPGPKFVFQNFVEGVIQCYENDPPFVGGPNFGKADPWMGFPFFGPNQCIGTTT